jgi:hypothetical protein
MNRGCAELRAAAHLTRRRLLQVGSIGLGSLGLPGWLRASESSASRLPARAKHVIFLEQFGGPSHLDTFDMKPDAPSGIRGHFGSIASDVPTLRLTEHLPEWSRVLSRCAQVRSVHHKFKNHNPATYYSLTGHAPPLDDIRLRDTLELYPAYGSTVARLLPMDDPSIPPFVAYPHVLRDGSVSPGQTASFLGKAYDPFFIGRDPASPDFRLPELTLPESLPLGRLDDRRGLLRMIDAQAELLEWSATAQGIDTFYDRAVAMLTSPRVKAAFDLSREKPEVRDAYGRHTHGQGCLLARRLIEAGVRFVTVYFSRSIGGKGSGGWDTHGDNFNQLKNRLLPIADQTVPTLIRDLEARGLLDETLIVWMGEFGRTPKINNTAKFGADGRDHWPYCYTAILAGGGIRGGAVYGSSDRIAAYPATDPVTPDDLAATMFSALGLDPATEIHDTLNRPLPIAAGQPITSLFS